MTETILVGLLSGVFGVIIAGIPTYLTQKNAPSRKVSDTAVIVDSTGKVVTMYRAEIDRLDHELTEERHEIKELKDELRRRPTREELLESVAELHDVIGDLRTQVRGLGGIPDNGT